MPNYDIGFFRTLATALKAGARSVVFMRSDVRAWAATPALFGVLVAMSLGLTIAWQMVYYGVPGRIDLSGLRGAFFELPLVLLAGWWAARVSFKGIGPLSLAVAFASLSVVLGAVEFAVIPLARAWPRGSAWVYWGAYWLFSLWWLLAACTLLWRFTGRGARGNWPGAMLVLIIGLAPIVLPSAPLWQADFNDTDRARYQPSIEREDAFHAQAHLLDQAFDGVLAQRAGVEDIYFVGFASHASQGVFRKELDAVGAVMRQRFDAEGRSVELVNHAETVLKQPLATQTNLRRALKLVGKRMNREEDVAVLYLTSHGSATHELDVSFWPLRLEQVTPASLKRMLDEAGIKWRVVIVSACYSGGYVEALKDEATLVMTASDATHTSFGCSNESEFTYFGRALFGEELRRTRSFPRAFERAVVSIREREKKMDFEHSNPQIWIGSRIAEKLARIEVRLEDAPRR
jgi:hypothetical protein